MAADGILEKRTEVTFIVSKNNKNDSTVAKPRDTHHSFLLTIKFPLFKLENKSLHMYNVKIQEVTKSNKYIHYISLAVGLI